MSIEPSEQSPGAEIAVQQLNLSYSQEQDRLLLKVGLSDQTEILLWLTQRVARMIWQLLSAESHLPATVVSQASSANIAPQQAVQQFKQEVKAVETLQKLDFETAYQPRKEALQAGGTLIKEVQLLQADASTHLNTQALEMQSVDGVNLRLNLTSETVVAICNMLQLSTKEAGWTLSASASATASIAITSTDQKQVLH
ncbi:hypothetical protein [Methylotenera sp. N17]|uniref:hypothetical protein n=1 Tax=Methylotenera sp. N17 TaxID=1502761 RepID=UPI00069227D5|nr:hypothetical protein [Methylotenera sp. N17]